MENSSAKRLGFVRTNEKSDNSHHYYKHHHQIGHKHGEGSAIDYYAYASKIRDWNPSFKVAFSGLTLLLCIVLNNQLVSLAVIVSMAYLTVVKGGLPLGAYLSVLMIPLTFIIFEYRCHRH